MIWLLPLCLVLGLAHSSPPAHLLAVPLKHWACSNLRVLTLTVPLARNTLPDLSHDSLPHNKRSLREALLDHSVQRCPSHYPSTLQNFYPFFIFYVSLTNIWTCSPSFVYLLILSPPSSPQIGMYFPQGQGLLLIWLLAAVAALESSRRPGK